MARREFSRLAERVLDRLGEDALLRGEPAGRVHIEHGVQLLGSEAQMAVERTVATMLRQHAPKIDDRLVTGAIVDGEFQGTDYYVVDSPPFQDNGYTVRVVVRDGR